MNRGANVCDMHGGQLAYREDWLKRRALQSQTQTEKRTAQGQSDIVEQAGQSLQLPMLRGQANLLGRLTGELGVVSRGGVALLTPAPS